MKLSGVMISAVGMFIAVATLAIGFLTEPVRAEGGCKSGPCDYYTSGGRSSGTCGEYTGSGNDVHCQCTYGNNSQEQQACASALAD
jgi:hypothetical protein